MNRFYCILIIVGLFSISSCNEDNKWEPSCNDLINISPFMDVNGSSAKLNIVGYTHSFFPNYDIEYDTVNFEIGKGVRVDNITLPYTIDNVDATQTYKVYIRRRCIDDNVSEWFGPFNSLFENLSKCEDIYSMYVDSSTTNYIKLQWNLLGDVVSYYESQIPGFYEIEYGELGFEQGNGISKITSNKFIELENLPAATAFDYYIRTNCGSDNYGKWKGPQSFATEE